MVLPGQDLGRRHQRPLPAGAAGSREGNRGHRCLAAPDIALQQPPHRLLASQVGDHLLVGHMLVNGQPEGQRLLQRGKLLGGDRNAWRPLATTRHAGLGEHQLQGQQLVVRQPIKCGTHLAGIVREVSRLQRRGQVGQARSLVSMQRIADIAQAAAKHPGQQLADATLGDSPSQRIDRDDAARVDRRGAGGAEVG